MLVNHQNLNICGRRVGKLKVQNTAVVSLNLA